MVAQFYIYLTGNHQTRNRTASSLWDEGIQPPFPWRTFSPGLGEYPTPDETQLSYLAVRHREGAGERVLLLLRTTHVGSDMDHQHGGAGNGTEDHGTGGPHPGPCPGGHRPGGVAGSGPWKFLALVAGVAGTALFLFARFAVAAAFALEFILVPSALPTFVFVMATGVFRAPRSGTRWPSNVFGGVPGLGNRRLPCRRTRLRTRPFRRGTWGPSAATATDDRPFHHAAAGGSGTGRPDDQSRRAIVATSPSRIQAGAGCERRPSGMDRCTKSRSPTSSGVSFFSSASQRPFIAAHLLGPIPEDWAAAPTSGRRGDQQVPQPC